MTQVPDQSPRDRVLAALAHRHPDRVPFAWGFCMTPEMQATMVAWCADRRLDWARLRAAAGDTVGIGPPYAGPPVPNGNEFIGIWGIRTMEADYGSGVYQEFTDFPLGGLTHPDQLADHPWPDPGDYDYDALPDVIERANPNGERAVQYFALNPFEIYCWMTGLEEALVNLLTNPDLVRRALDHITGFGVERLERTLAAAEGRIDIVFFADDMGSQAGLLMSREVYREVLQPYHRRLTEAARRCAPHAHRMIHSDGAVFDVVPDFIDAGFDVLEAVQTDATGMDPDRLKGAYGDALSFHGGISVQQLLPHADTAAVTSKCRRLVEVLGNGGGYIAAPSHAIQAGTPPGNVMAMLEAVLGPEDFASAVEAAGTE